MQMTGAYVTRIQEKQEILPLDRIVFGKSNLKMFTRTDILYMRRTKTINSHLLFLDDDILYSIRITIKWKIVLSF